MKKLEIEQRMYFESEIYGELEYCHHTFEWHNEGAVCTALPSAAAGRLGKILPSVVFLADISRWRVIAATTPFGFFHQWIVVGVFACVFVREPKFNFFSALRILSLYAEGASEKIWVRFQKHKQFSVPFISRYTSHYDENWKKNQRYICKALFMKLTH